MDSNSTWFKELNLLVTGAEYLLTGRSYMDQTVYRGFENREGRSPRLFVMVSGSEARFLLICPAAHTYEQYPMFATIKLSKLLHLEEEPDPAYLVFIEHGDLQNDGSGWRGCHCLEYHTYPIKSSYDLKDVVAFEYEATFTVIKQPVVD